MISYAQNFEDVMLYRVFRDQPTGFYVDVGAADPAHHSVTKWFYDLGWSGINVEPRSVFFETLQRERPRDVNLNCGAGAVSGEATFFEMSVTPEWSSFDDVARTEAVARGEPIVERTLPILTLNDIIERHGEGRTIDFLKIDVEGWEREVVMGLDLSRHRPTVIVIEATHQGTVEPNHAAWEDILTNADYCPVYFDGLNKFYVTRDKIELARHFAVPPNVFDDYKLREGEELLAMLERCQTEGEERLKGVHVVTAMLKKSEAEGEGRLEQVHTLTAMLKKSEAEGEARLEQVHTLTAMLKKSEAEGEERLKGVHALTAMLKKSEAEGEARLEQIHTFAAMLKKCEANGAEWLEQVKQLKADLAELIDRHNALLITSADLSRRAASYDHLIATLQMPEAPRSLKIVLPLARMFRKVRAIFG